MNNYGFGFDFITRPKARGPVPSYGDQMTIQTPVNNPTSTYKQTPFRLPRKREEEEGEEGDRGTDTDREQYRVWSRHGYDYYGNRLSKYDL